MKRIFHKISIVPGIITGVVIFVLICNILMSRNYPIYGEKLESGIQVAYGTITSMTTVHGGDWHMRLNSSPHSFEFPWGTFSPDNRPQIGENIAIAYEWQLIFTQDCCCTNGDCHPRYVWKPMILDWEMV